MDRKILSDPDADSDDDSMRTMRGRMPGGGAGSMSGVSIGRGGRFSGRASLIAIGTACIVISACIWLFRGGIQPFENDLHFVHDQGFR